MKPWLTILFFSAVFCGPVAGQQGPPYGPVGIIAVSDDSDRETVMRFAQGLSDTLRKEEKVRVEGSVQFVPMKAASPDEFLKLSDKLSVSWLVVASLTPSDSGSDKDGGIVNVEVLHEVAHKIASGASALLWRLRETGGKVSGEIYRAAVSAAHAVTTLVSQFKEVWTILQLHSSPSEANYVFCKSGSKVTDKDGIGYWEGTQQAGKCTLQVWKAGYSSASVDIQIPTQGSTPYVVPLQVITLKATH